MTIPSPRAPSRRRFLGGASATLGATLALPRAVLAAADTLPPPVAPLALAFDGDAIVAATGGAEPALWRHTSKGATRLPDTVFSDTVFPDTVFPDTGGPDTGGSITALSTHPARQGTLFAAFGTEAGGRTNGLRRSRDGGQTWTKADTGLPDTPITGLTIAALEPDMLYAALAGDGLWRSQDAGESWELVMDRPYLDGAEHDVLSLVSVGNATGMGGIWLYGGTAAGLSRVPDCFCRWQDVTPGNAMDALVAGNSPPPTTPLPADEPVTNLALAPDTPKRLYAGLQSGLWSSDDAGVNWALASAGAIGALAVDPADPLHLAAARDGGLSISRDGGTSWTSSTSIKDL
ncbi:WD40/YVTN/BNR-like repeat-containing protein [Brevirhabdus sp.]|uniref:WD40/YVTN/BNR-like repeat-containing protein n=1 Tax=Brevirhabdus sp. TaxID=2004514 RepID=UPI00405819FB